MTDGRTTVLGLAQTGQARPARFGLQRRKWQQGEAND
jgi:hypothetical protein